MACVGWNGYLFPSPVHGRNNVTSRLLDQPSFARASSTSHAVLAPVLRATSEDQQASPSVDVSVFRFTLGIPGFNDSDLPRVLGIAFGAILVLNHFLTGDYVTAAQWRSEIIGLCNVIFSISLPSIGMRLNGGGQVNAASSMPRSRQIFALSKTLSSEEKEELAWGTYVLLKNTRATSVVVWNEHLICARGLWDIPDEASKDVLEWLEEILRKSPLFSSGTLTYIPSKADKQGWSFLPTGTVCSLLIPSDWATAEETGKQPQVTNAFLLCLSSTPNAFNQKDLLWIKWLAIKLMKSRPLSRNEIKA
ncbi:hypothetical protein KP509_19G066300 [Ceratopteris richardii]|uniref:Protein COFACTOR ASSEMBLY OF COMPLEX C SUBUNIT B CCB2, chloroplastic n=1 Tax=Ceratopteris richardii TaxID=49495 RepID=A0A8T2SPT5_CERRI|nr:hypothetical protein KP509_19G066300 [Ceratopteris richardii]